LARGRASSHATVTSRAIFEIANRLILRLRAERGFRMPRVVQAAVRQR